MDTPTREATAAAVRLMLSTPYDDRAQLRRDLCLARGVHPDDIDSSTGHDISRRAYNVVRAAWREIAANGPMSEHTQRGYQSTRAYWEQRRPEWTTGDDWLAGHGYDLTAA